MISRPGLPSGRRPIPSSAPRSRSTSKRRSPSIGCRATNLLERLNEEIKRRTDVVRIFPNAESCLRLIRELAVEMHENWLEAHHYLNMDDLREHKK